VLCVLSIPLATITGFTPPPTSRVDMKSGSIRPFQPSHWPVKLGGKKAAYISSSSRTFARARAVIASIVDSTNVVGLRQIAMDSTPVHVKDPDRIVGGE
jgi:hypothetical protein